MNPTAQTPPQDNGASGSDSEAAPATGLTFGVYVKRLLVVWLQYLLTATLIFFSVQLLTWLPDIDRWAVEVLHHRSILTHSILLPLLFWFAVPKTLSMVASVLFAAFGVHLSADILAPSVGYGAIWLPAPFKMNLGEASKIWLLVNAVAAFAMALRSTPDKYVHGLIFGSIFSCIFYGLANEGSSISALVSVVFFLGGLFIYSRIWSLPRNPLSSTAELMSQRRKSKLLLSAKRREMRAQRGRFWLMKSVLVSPYSIILGLYRASRWSLGNPKKAISFTVIAILTTGWFYAVGSSSDTVAGAIAGGAAKTVSDGVWVLHSSGGWILKEGGQYVAGTLSATKPD